MVVEPGRAGRRRRDRKIAPVARILIIGGGCLGRRLASEMAGEGHAVRVTSRSEARRAAIQASGAECWIGTPDRVATLRGALDGVTLACWLLASATGSEQELRVLHGSRLQAFLRQLIDTSVRGLIYEAAGTAPADVLAHGEREARALAEQNAIPMRAITVDRLDVEAWLDAARAAVGALLEEPSPERR
jgi:uncharacterized protein YbjT (DUF2867 family)